MQQLDKDAERLDLGNGWLHWFSDGGEVRGSSMVWAKELPRPDKSPLMFVHMAKPHSGSRKPEVDQTFVMELIGRNWVDVTSKVIPAAVDLKQHFRTRQQDTTIEVAEWEQFERADGRGQAWRFGTRVIDLHWNGRIFIVRKPESRNLTKN